MSARLEVPHERTELCLAPSKLNGFRSLRGAVDRRRRPQADTARLAPNVGTEQVLLVECSQPKHFQKAIAEIRSSARLGSAWVASTLNAELRVRVLIYMDITRWVRSFRNAGVTGSSPVSGTICGNRRNCCVLADPIADSIRTGG